MKDYRPEVVAWRWCKPIVNDHGETVGGAWKLGGAPGFLPWWPNEPLVRLSDYERLQAMHVKLLNHLQSLIDQTTPLEPEPDNPMWSRRIRLDEVMVERDELRVKCGKLAETLLKARSAVATLAGIRGAGVYEGDEVRERTLYALLGEIDDHRKEGDPCTTNA